MNNKNTLTQIVLVAIVIIYVIYAFLFIFNSSNIINGKRYFCLFDDAMISMRYAQNFANGEGLVWNPGGERVEGYTNPLWVIYMSLFNLLPIGLSRISLPIQISGAIFIIISLFIIRKLSLSFTDEDSATPFAPLIFTAFYLPINNWSLQGMEVSVLILITSLLALSAIRQLNNASSILPLHIIGAIGTFVRIDMVVPYFAAILFISFTEKKKRKETLLGGIIVVLLCLLSQTLFRYFYYGDILPNTYYLKMTGYPVFLRISRGFLMMVQFASRMGWVLFLLPFAALIFNRSKAVFLLLYLFIVQILYSVYVGGDAWEWWGGSNRYISIVMPLFFILFSYALYQITDKLFSVLGRGKKYPKLLSLAVFTLICAICLIQFNRINNFDALRKWTLLEKPLHTEEYARTIGLSLLLKESTTDDARIAFVRAGAMPYFTQRYAIDILGKNDNVISRIRMRQAVKENKYTFFYPGHIKWDYSYSIGKLKPDAIAQLWRKREEAYPFIKDDYKIYNFKDIQIFFRKDSSKIKWDKVKSNFTEAEFQL